MRPLRGLLLFKLGAWAGMMAAAAYVRRTVPSLGHEESDELSLVAVFDGITLRSRATAFAGGSMLAWFGGIEVDLREAELAPDARLSLHTLFGGIEVKTPAEWRLDSDLKAVAGGVNTGKSPQAEPDAPVLKVTGTALFGGIDIGPKTRAGVPAPAAGGNSSAADTAD